MRVDTMRIELLETDQQKQNVIVTNQICLDYKISTCIRYSSQQIESDVVNSFERTNQIAKISIRI